LVGSYLGVGWYQKVRKRKKKKEKKKEKKKYLIDIGKVKGIYCGVFFL
jgi:hypothetical protein